MRYTTTVKFFNHTDVLLTYMFLKHTTNWRNFGERNTSHSGCKRGLPFNPLIFLFRKKINKGRQAATVTHCSHLSGVFFLFTVVFGGLICIKVEYFFYTEKHHELTYTQRGFRFAFLTFLCGIYVTLLTARETLRFLNVLCSMYTTAVSQGRADVCSPRLRWNTKFDNGWAETNSLFNKASTIWTRFWWENGTFFVYIKNIYGMA